MYLLVNPWIHDFSAYDLWIQPLGLLYLAAVLEENGQEVRYINCLDSHESMKEDGRGKFSKQLLPTPEPLRGVRRRYGRYGIQPDAFRKQLEELQERPDAVLVTSGMTYWYPGVRETIREVRQFFPQTRIFLGGIYATLMPEHAREFSEADAVISGQSETRILDLLVQTPQKLYASIDDYPLPAWHHTGQNKYRIVYSSRGCPYRCTFCASDILNAEVFFQRDPNRVYHEIEKFYIDEGVRHIVFYDDALLIRHRSHLEPILQMVIDHGWDLKFHAPNGLNAREVDSRLAELMYRSGFATIRLSLESSNPEIQKHQANRKITNELFVQAVENLYRAGYREGDLECYLIMGLPGQTKRDVEDSIDFVASLGVSARLATFSPIPGTPEARASEKFLGRSFFEEPLLQNHSCSPLRQQGISEIELQEIKDRCKEKNSKILAVL